jgi:hypothetical protein
MCKIKIISMMKVKILKGKMWGIRKLAKMKFGYPVKVGIYEILLLSTSYMKQRV